MALKLMLSRGDRFRIEGPGGTEEVTVLFIGEGRIQLAVDAPQERRITRIEASPGAPRRRRTRA